MIGSPFRQEPGDASSHVSQCSGQRRSMKLQVGALLREHAQWVLGQRLARLAEAGQNARIEEWAKDV